MSLIKKVGVSMDNTLKGLGEKIRPLGFNLSDDDISVIVDTKVGRCVGYFRPGMDVKWCDVRWFKLARRMGELGYEYRFDTDRRAHLLVATDLNCMCRPVTMDIT